MYDSVQQSEDVYVCVKETDKQTHKQTNRDKERHTQRPTKMATCHNLLEQNLTLICDVIFMS